MARKRQRIYKRTLKNGDARYDVSFEFTDAASGRRKPFMRTYRTEREAVQALAEHEAQRGKGQLAAQPSATLAQCAQDWMQAYAAHVRPTTVVTYRSTLAHHVLPQLGMLATSKVTLRRLEDHYRALRTAGVKDGMVRNAHQRVVQILRWAALRGYAVDASALQARTPHYEPREMTCWTDDEMTCFLAVATSSSYGPIWRVALHTGMRRGEVMGLRWQDIDWEGGSIRVAQSRTLVGKEIRVGATKNGLTRTISVPGSLLDALREHRAAQLQQRLQAGSGWREPELVFTNHQGGTIHPYSLRYNLDMLVKRAGLAPIRIHDLRHTHASFLLRHGKSAAEVAKRLGHKNVAQTLNTYAHCIPDEHKATAELLGRLFG